MIAVVAVIVGVLLAILFVGRPDSYLVGGGLLLLVASFGLVRRLWFAWLFLTVVAVGDLVNAALTWPAWGALVVNGTLLILLVAPSTRRHVRPPRFLRHRPIS